MAIATTGSAMWQLGRLFATGTAAGLTDGQLLQRFLDRRDPDAFGALVARHGPMVMAVCRGVLRDPAAAEDAFQATFLVLVKKARAVRGHRALGGWLHRVAHRAATRAGRGTARRRHIEAEAAMNASRTAATGPGPWDDLRPILHDEIARLPDRCRLAVVLCDLEGLPQAEAAAQLGWSERTLRRRLADARSLLGARVGRRGVAPALAPIGLLLAVEARAAVPSTILDATVRLATVAAAPGAASTLAQGVLNAMWYTKVKLAAATLVGAGALTWAGAALVADDPKPMPAKPPTPDARPAPADPAGTLVIRGRVVDPAGKPLPGAAIYVDGAALNPTESSRQATAGPDGRFEVALSRTETDGRRDGPIWRRSTVGAHAPGFSPAWVVAGEVGEREVELRLRPDDAPIRGRVVDPQGRPIAGATVDFMGLAEVRPGAADAMLGAGQLDPAQQRSNFGCLAWYGPLTQTPTGPKVSTSRTTGPDGRFEVRGAGRDRIACLNVDAPGLEHAQIHAMARPMPADAGPRPAAPRFGELDGRSYMPPLYPESFDVVLGPAKPIVGVVRSKATGRPVAGATIYATVIATRAYANATTDAEGRYEIKGLPKSETYDVHALPRPGQPVLQARARVADTEGLKPIEVDFALPRGVVLKARLRERPGDRLVPSGQAIYVPLPGNAAEGQSGGAGPFVPGEGFTLTVPPGGGMLLAEAAGTDAPYPRARLAPADKGRGIGGMGDGETVTTMMDAFHAYKILDVPADAETLDVDLDLRPGGRRAGTLVAEDRGGPVDGAQAYGLVAGWAVRTLDGPEFEALGLEPGRERTAVFTHRARNLAGSAVVAAGDGPLSVLMLRCGAAVGRLVDEDGQPMAGVELRSHVIGPDGQTLPVGTGYWPEGEHVATDADGRFRVEGINPTLGLSLSATPKGKPVAFLDAGGKLEKLKPRPGQTIDLGEIRVKPAER